MAARRRPCSHGQRPCRPRPHNRLPSRPTSRRPNRLARTQHSGLEDLRPRRLGRPHPQQSRRAPSSESHPGAGNLGTNRRRPQSSRHAAGRPTTPTRGPGRGSSRTALLPRAPLPPPSSPRRMAARCRSLRRLARRLRRNLPQRESPQPRPSAHGTDFPARIRLHPAPAATARRL
jgi:hypothetical protein